MMRRMGREGEEEVGERGGRERERRKRERNTERK